MRGRDAARAVLAFDAAVFDLGGRTLQVDFRLGPGGLVIVRVENHDAARLLADAVPGLVAPISGDVRFCDKSWKGLSTFDTDARRGRIGTAFADDALAPHLGMFDNMALRAAFHRDLTPGALREQVRVAMRAFGLPGAPGDALPIADDRRRAALARAFVGTPELIVIEHTAEPLPRDLAEALMNAILVARTGDAAVVWLADPRDLAQVETPPDAVVHALSARRFTLREAAELS